MSRLDTYRLPNIGFGDPFSSLMRPPRQVTPDEQSTLDYLGETGLGGLAYLGKLADKTFGGRAVRGLLGGNTNEALSILPFSDTLGLTNERDIVYGKKLLEDAGFLTPDPEPGFGWNDVAGIAADIALDPATYLGFGPLTRAGSIAKKFGTTLPKTTAARIGGFTARESELAAEAARAGTDVPSVMKQLGITGESIIPTTLEQEASRLGLPLNPRYSIGSTPGVNAIGDPILVSSKTAQEATPLAGALGVGLPFSEKIPFLTGDVGAWLARNNPIRTATAPLRAADRLIDRTTGFSPGRAMGALFDPEVKDLYSENGQTLGRFATGLEGDLKRAAMYPYAEHVQDLAKVLGNDPNRVSTGLRYALAHAEDAELAPDLMAATGRYPVPMAPQAGTMFAPAEVDAIEQIMGTMKGQMEGRRLQNEALGIASPELSDIVSYFLRSQQVLPKQPGEGLFNYLVRSGQQYSATHQSQIAREPIFKGIPGGTDQLNVWATDPRMSGLSRTSQPLAIQQEIAQHLGAANPFTPGAAQAQAERLTDWLHTLPSAHAQGASFFSPDAVNNFAKYMSRTGKAQSAAETTYEGLARFSEPIVPGAPNADRLVPIGKVLEDVGLVGRDATGQPIAPLIAAQRMGVSPLDLAHMGIDRSLYHDLRRLNQAWQNPGAIMPVLAAWDAASAMFKTWMTIPFVAYHMRNLGQSIFSMWRGGEGPLGAIDPTAMGLTKNFMRGQGFAEKLPWMRGNNVEEWTRELTTALIGENVALVPRANNASDVLGHAGEQIMKRPNLPVDSKLSLAGDVGQFIKGFAPEKWSSALDPRNLLHVRGVLGAENSANTVVRQMENMGRMIDDWGRISHFVALSRQGWSPRAAAAEVSKYHLDYANLSNFDKQVSRRLMPWFAFSRRNLPPILEDIASNPAKLQATLRATTEGRTPFEYTPAYIAEGASIPIPGAEPGSQRYISSFGLSPEDEAVKLLGELAHGNLTRAGQVAFGMAMPQIKLPIEQLFGTQLYSGRRLSDLKPYGFLGDMGVPEDTARQITQVIQAVPGSRGASTLDKALDQRKDWVSRLFNVGTGVKVSDVDAEQQKLFAEKRLIADLLEGQPGIKKSEDVYVSKRAKDEGRVTPQEQKLLDLYSKINSEIQRESRLRR